jgi:hypothetical protein
MDLNGVDMAAVVGPVNNLNLIIPSLLCRKKVGPNHATMLKVV